LIGGTQPHDPTVALPPNEVGHRIAPPPWQSARDSSAGEVGAACAPFETTARSAPAMGARAAVDHAVRVQAKRRRATRCPISAFVARSTTAAIYQLLQTRIDQRMGNVARLFSD
jgi:hypothetical protein